MAGSTTEGRFGYTDTGLKGIRDFFRNHVCNAVCHGLGLPPVTEERPRPSLGQEGPQAGFGAACRCGL